MINKMKLCSAFAGSSWSAMGRKPNFSDAEKVRLIEAYEARKTVLVGKFCSNVSSRRKHDAWLEIKNEINSRNPHVTREIEDLQKNGKICCPR